VVVKTQLGARVSQLHKAMLGELCDRYGMNEGDMLSILIDRAWHEMRQAAGLPAIPAFDSSGRLVRPRPNDGD
jgi:hypothetical protein